MSTFFSNKYLKYRRMLERRDPPIAIDAPCKHCGYNLRGLHLGGTCPECGRRIPLNVETALDPLLAGDPQIRWRTMMGLTLMSLSVAALVGLRLGGGVMMSMTRWPGPTAYLAVLMMIALVWNVGVWMGTPSTLDVRRPSRTPIRWLARVTQLLWIPATAGPLVVALSTGVRLTWEDEIAFWSMAFATTASIGWLVLAFVLLQAAEDVELDDAPRRIGLAIWTVAPLTAVLMFVPMRMVFFVLAIVLPLLLAWAWYLVGFARGVWELRQYVAWGVRQVDEADDREARIAARKAELDAIAQANIRALPNRPHAPPTEPGPIPKQGFWR